MTDTGTDSGVGGRLQQAFEDLKAAVQPKLQELGQDVSQKLDALSAAIDQVQAEREQRQNQRQGEPGAPATGASEQPGEAQPPPGQPPAPQPPPR